MKRHQHIGLDCPIGGNYWSNWHTPDNDGDGFVDIPYGADLLPWAKSTVG